MAPGSVRRNLPPEKIRDKILRYCAYQERSHLEVRQKLLALGTPPDGAEEIIVFLINEGFLNEERFARSYARGKFRMKNWGRIRIALGLEAKGVAGNCIQLALREIDSEEYLATLRKVLSLKADETHDDNLFVRRNKIASFAIRKGFEPELVWENLRDLIPDK